MFWLSCKLSSHLNSCLCQGYVYKRLVIRNQINFYSLLSINLNKTSSFGGTAAASEESNYRSIIKMYNRNRNGFGNYDNYNQQQYNQQQYNQQQYNQQQQQPNQIAPLLGLGYQQQNFAVSLMNNQAPPPPPPDAQSFNCGDLRSDHNGLIVELCGKVKKTRLGRFIELKDQVGYVQLVAPPNVPKMTSRFLNMPINAQLTVIGEVKRRPQTLCNKTLPTGDIEVHVQYIKNVNLRPQQPQLRKNQNIAGGQKRSYCSMCSGGKPDTESLKMTSHEYKRASKSVDFVNFFKNRKHTCDSLGKNDVKSEVQLVGWFEDKHKKGDRFYRLYDGHGCTQIVVDSEEIRAKLLASTENDLILVKGTVALRPYSHQSNKTKSGGIEVICNHAQILNEDSIIEVTEEEIMETDDSIVAAESEQTVTNKYTYRSHNCGELTAANVGEFVELCGWFEFQRMKKFFTLRDGYGRIQILIPEEISFNPEDISFESILKVSGRVCARPQAMQNLNMPTGEIEVVLDSYELLNVAQRNLPIEVRDFNRAKDNLRLEYRYIDLRFPNMQHNLRLRSKILMKMREYLINSAGFVEVETPTLFRKTPGGAQEFIVPSRKAGHCFSLVQSPQQFKQMLMAGAIDRYFQIARCYRDETTRPDRQPEFTQLDIELSFTNREGIMSLVENLLSYCWPTEQSIISTPFPILTYADAMDRYGSDKPDTRFELHLQNVTDVLSTNTNITADFEDFAAYALKFGVGEQKHPAKVLREELLAITDKLNVKFYFCNMPKEPAVWAKKNIGSMTEKSALHLIERVELKKGEYLLLAFGTKEHVQTSMGRVRLATQTHLEENQIVPVRSNDKYKFLWVIDFPMFTPSPDKEQWESTHHPFTAPHSEDADALLKADAGNLHNIRSQAYDLVLNGQEVGGGSIRIHDADLQCKILDDILRIDHSHLSHLIDALRSGCPPHGGIALGLDRLISILCNASSLRDVIAFPKGLDGRDPLSKAPFPMSAEDLKLYNISVTGSTQDINSDN